jgi:hypothetical protein
MIFKMKWIYKGLQIILFLLLLSSSFMSYAASIAKEYQIKAVFLYNFANFIRWPYSAFSHYQAPFNICILGDDPFQQGIDVMVENEDVKGHLVKVKRFQNIENVDNCQILFISQSEKFYLKQIFFSIQQRPILTVSDMDNFVTQGGMIQFFKKNRRVRFYIAIDTLKEAGLKASVNLLRIAKIVRK